MVKKPKPLPTKFERIDLLLSNFGKGLIDRDRFWREMKAGGWTQDDIDWWADLHHTMENSKMLGNNSEVRR